MAETGKTMDIEEAVWVPVLERAEELGRDARFEDVSDDVLRRQVRSQAAEIAAATCVWLEHVAELVVRGIWADDGARSPAEWLARFAGESTTTARDHVRVGLRLRELPLVRERFAAGTLSYSKVRAITRVATPDIEGLLLEWADAAPTNVLERIIRGFRTTLGGGPPAGRADAERTVTSRQVDGQTTVVSVRLPTADAAQLLDDLDRLVDLDEDAEDRAQDDAELEARATLPLADASFAGPSDAPASTPPAARPSRRTRKVDVLLAAVAQAVADGPRDTSGLDRHLTVTIADRRDLAGASAEAPHRGRHQVMTFGADGRARGMPRSSLRRLACDGLRAPVTLHPTRADQGRTSRVVTPALRRLLRLRDRHCQFPGCRATRHVHAHHVVHWADGGRTDLANLVLVCSHHHRYVHEHEWTITLTADGVRFRPPGAPAPAPDVEALLGASAEAPSARYLDRMGRPAPDDALDIPHWDGVYDLDACVTLLAQRARPDRPDRPNRADDLAVAS